MEVTTKDILRVERVLRGLTQEDVAQILGMARGSYAKYETGHNIPTTENIIKLADLYNVTTDYLLCRQTLGAYNKKVLERGIARGEEIADEIIENKKRVRKKPKKA